MMDSADEFSFGNLIGQIRSFHSKWEELRDERDALRLSLEEANSKISELEVTITQCKAKDALFEKEKYLLSHVLNTLHEEIVQEDHLSKKINQLEENVERLNEAIENSLSDDNYGTKSSSSITGSMVDEQESELENNIHTNELALIANDHEYNQQYINSSDFLIGNDFSLAFDDVSESSLLQETEETLLEKEKKENPTEFSKLSTIQSASTSFSTSVQSHANALSKGNANLNKSTTEDCKLTLPDFLSSLSDCRPGFSYEHSKFPNFFSSNFDELPSSVITTSSKFSFQSETGNEIVRASFSSNDQNMINSFPSDDKNAIFGCKKMESIQQKMNNFGNVSQTAGASSFKVLANLYNMKDTFRSCRLSNKLEEHVKSVGDVDNKLLQKEIPLRYNLRERKLLKNRKHSADEDNLNSDCTDSHSSKDKSCADKSIVECKKARKSDIKSGNYLTIAGTSASNATKSHPLIENLFTKNTQRLKNICIICKKRNPNSQVPLFVNCRELDRHIIKNHPEPSPEYHRCPYVKENCIRHFKFKEHLRWHINILHQNKKSNSPPEKCASQEKSRPCVFCDKVFTRLSDFKNHVKRDHSSMLIKPSATKIACKICDYVANSPKTMAIHKLKRHKIGQQETPSREPKNANDL